MNSPPGPAHRRGFSRMLAHTRIGLALLVALALLPVGCDADDSENDITTARVERGDPPARPPPGWRTVRNRSAGFTVSVPNSWRADGTERRTVIRSDDRLVAI